MSLLDTKKAMYRGKIVPDYYVDNEGYIYSTKRGYYHQMSMNISGNTPYPYVNLVIDGKSTRVAVHTIVCETFHKKPAPNILTKKEWNSIEKDIRDKLISYLTHADRFQVNHIDHDHTNHHPSNLEWVSQRENIEKYQTFSKAA
jgi:hypothetical protein